MAGQLLLVNPRKRRRRRNPESRATRSRAAKAGWRHRRRASRRRRNPESRRERVAAARRGWAHRRRHNPIRHHRRRRNPISRKMGFFAPVMPAVMGAVGALGLSVLWGYAPIPTTWKSGTMGYAAKGLGALAVGAGLGMVVKKQTAEALTVGMLTVVFADALKGMLQTSMPNVPLGEIQPYTGGMGYLSPGVIVTDQPQSLSYEGTNAINNSGYDLATQAGMTY